MQRVTQAKRLCSRQGSGKSFNVKCLLDEAHRLEEEGEMLAVLAIVRHIVNTCAKNSNYEPVEMVQSMLPLVPATSVVAFALRHHLDGKDTAPLTRAMYQVSLASIAEAGTAHLVVEQCANAIAELRCVPPRLIFAGLCGEVEDPVGKVTASINGPVFQGLSKEERASVCARLHTVIEGVVEAKLLVEHAFEACFHE